MFIHTRIKYSIFLIIPLILLILLPAVSLADADRIFRENSKAVVGDVFCVFGSDIVGACSGIIDEDFPAYSFCVETFLNFIRVQFVWC